MEEEKPFKSNEAVTGPVHVSNTKLKGPVESHKAKASGEINEANAVFGFTPNNGLTVDQYKPDSHNLNKPAKRTRKEFGTNQAENDTELNEYAKNKEIDLNSLTPKQFDKAKMDSQQNKKKALESYNNISTAEKDRIPDLNTPEGHLWMNEFALSKAAEMGAPETFKDKVIAAGYNAGVRSQGEKKANEQKGKIESEATIGKNDEDISFQDTSTGGYNSDKANKAKQVMALEGLDPNDTANESRYNEIMNDNDFDEKYKEVLNANEKLKGTPEGPLKDYYNGIIDKYQTQNRANQIMASDPSMAPEVAQQIAEREKAINERNNPDESYKSIRSQYEQTLQRALKEDYSHDWAREKMDELKYMDAMSQKYPDLIKPETAQQILQKDMAAQKQIENLYKAGEKEKAQKIKELEKQKAAKRKEILRIVSTTAIPLIIGLAKAGILVKVYNR